MSPSSYPAPFLVSPTWSFGGDDGNWSTFGVSIGTPPQSFGLLPSTASSETWVPIPAGCQGILADVANCGSMRAVSNFDGAASDGFQTNASSTWAPIGIYDLTEEQNLYGTSDDGLYGLDVVTLDSTTGKNQNTSLQTVAGYATADFWLGILGLGTAYGNFSVQSDNIPSLLDSMENQQLVPSLSFGYAAGASYHSPPDYGSLVLGGYDQSRFASDGNTFQLSGTHKDVLRVSVESMITQNTNSEQVSLSPRNGNGSVSMVIDSTVSQLWFPQEVCNHFAQAFNLTYDSTTNLYLVDSATHTLLLSQNPEVTFTIGGPNSGSSSKTQTIALPYGAFDLQAGIPIYNSSTNYFPLRVAANDSQNVLGRVFLQEAYMIVDWERGNFTVAQAIHQNATTDIVPILPVAASHASTGLSAGVIAGIAVAIVVAAAALAGLILFFVLRDRRRKKSAKEDEIAAHYADEKAEKVPELHSDHVVPNEIMSAPVHEMQGDHAKNEAMSTPVHELSGHDGPQELDGENGKQAYGQGDYKEDLAKGDVRYELA